MTSHTPGSGRYDAIVVGGGHNGLVCGAYLAKAGLRTLILERRSRLGGAAETDEVWPGVRVSVLAHTVGRLRPSVARDLELRRHGLRLVQPQVRVFAPAADGPSLTLWGDAMRTAAELERSSPTDADRWPAFDLHVRRLAGVVAGLLALTPPDLRRPSPTDALGGLQLALRYRGLGREDGGAFLRVLPMPIGDFVGEWLESDALRAVVAARGLLYGSAGPRGAGTTNALLTDSAGNDGGAAGQSVMARGGSGALPAALASSARSFGAELRTGQDVAAIRSRDDRVTGVALASGEEIEAPIVASGLDPKRTLLQLVDPGALGPTLAWRAGNLRLAGSTAKVNLGLSALPAFRGLEDGVGEGSRRLRGRIVIAGGMTGLDRASDAPKYGWIPARPLLEATIPTLVDPELVDPGRAGAVRHVMSLIVHWAPFALRGTDWKREREGLADRVVDVLEETAPGFRESVVRRHVVTPVDLERDYGMTGGHPLHGEAGLDQWFAWRPLLGHARYRMPLDGLYLCGSGAHPGGGVTGGPGQNAAREILRDRRSVER